MKPVAISLWAAAMLAGLQLSALSPGSFVDHSSKNLSSVPADLPETVERLDLSCNHIRQLRRGDFNNTRQLMFLNVSWNSLEEIHPDTFLDTPALRILDLSHNRLKNLSGQQYLLHTESLGLLNLAYNEFLTTTLGVEFSSLVNLERLALGGRNISKGDFENIARAKLLSLTLFLEDELHYEAGSLQDVNARRLQIAFSASHTQARILFFDALSRFREVELLNLRAGYKELSQQLIEMKDIHTSRLSLTNISIEWKDLTDLINVVLRTSIEDMSASDVVMRRLPTWDTPVAQTSRVKSFSARRAEVKSFFFSQEAVYNFFINMPVESLAIVETSIIHMTCPKQHSPILRLDFSFCALSDTIFSRVEGKETLNCETLDSVTNLMLAGNNFKNLRVMSERMQYMRSLQHVDLSINSLVYGQGVCKWPSNIITMSLSSNSLNGSVFECLPTGTEVLDLENNQISVVPSSILKLERLSSLNLNSNRLRDLPGCKAFPLLSRLLLKTNSIHAPSVKELRSCPQLRTLDVSNNPYTCTCALRGFLSLGVEQQRHHPGLELLSWPGGYSCTYPEDVRGSKLNIIWIPEVACSAGLQAAAILCPAVALIVSVLTLCRRLDLPWYLGMIWKWTRAKHRARRRQVRPEDLLGVRFHAFVSYSQHDADWVHDSLLPNLEGPSGGGLRICHHEKHFVPGQTIVQNIISCLEKSRRSVFVLSAHFVKSEWCHYELYFASHQRLAYGSDSVVLVLLEPLPQYLIPSKYHQLKSMMSRHTYLEWPQDKAKRRLFWANLRAALQAELPNVQATQLEE